ncbi:MAG: cobalamin biosynthesis protein CbiD [Deltaproteobacteria bacterium]|nr:cobalamin biosynthesis protein CbiD [Deltaproteobacteria bacterium]
MRDTGKTLKKGFTTGTCAAAGAKAAAMAVFALPGRLIVKTVLVTLPSGNVLNIKIKTVRVFENRAVATVVKDAGDDPDVTNGAEIVTEVELVPESRKTPPALACPPLKACEGRLKRGKVVIKGGEGVGMVTRPGLKIRPGRPAINPVPLAMIKRAVLEAAREAGVKTTSAVVTVSVPEGKRLALKTMNPRLGITGGISILGTSGIVEPMSLSAYRHSISLGVDVALANGCSVLVYSTGRSTEKAVQKAMNDLPETAFILTGDHMGHALKDALGRPLLRKAVIAGQFAKFSKLAAGHFETHCSDASVELAFLAGLCRELAAPPAIIKKVENANTAREVFFILKASGCGAVLKAVCALVKKNAARITGKGFALQCVLAGYSNDIVCVC